MRFFPFVASLGCIAAGAYLLQTQAVGESSWFEAIAHGMGIYFIAKGLFVGPALWQSYKQTALLEQLVASEKTRVASARPAAEAAQSATSIAE